MSDHIIVKICPICKKTFIPAPQHIYKVKGQKVCSYTCTLPGAKEKKRKEAKDNGCN
jgi:hypothetical protein